MNKYINKLSVAVLLLATTSPTIALADDTTQKTDSVPQVSITQPIENADNIKGTEDIEAPSTTEPSVDVENGTSSEPNEKQEESEGVLPEEDTPQPSDELNNPTVDNGANNGTSELPQEPEQPTEPTEPEKQYGTVTAKHVYNSPIQEDITEDIAMNEDGTYSTKPRETGKFHLVQIIGDAVGTFPESGKHIVVTYIYSASDIVIPTNPDVDPVVPETDDGQKQNPDNIKTDNDKKEIIAEIKHEEVKSNEPVEVKPVVSEVKDIEEKKATLPETGVAENPLFVIFGVIFIAVAMMGVWVVTKGSKKE